jgi:pyridoxamine 5'-phosphate oxidase
VFQLKELIDRFNDGLRRAREAGLHLPEGASLATVSGDGLPSVRMILVKGADERGFVFYTNLASRKAREMAKNPRVSVCVWWPTLEEQVRIEGVVEPVSDEEADRYFSTRPHGSQIGAWASRQSEVLPDRTVLETEFKAIEKRFAGATVPRPPFWSGFIVVPHFIEFWRGREDRLHERECFERKQDGWTRHLLQP